MLTPAFTSRLSGKSRFSPGYTPSRSVISAVSEPKVSGETARMLPLDAAQRPSTGTT